MSAARTGTFHTAMIAGEWHVLFEPDDLRRHFLSIARFNSRDRADSYADMEIMFVDDAGGPTLPEELDAIRAIPFPAEPPGARRALEAPKPAPIIPEIIPEPAATRTEPAPEPQHIKEIAPAEAAKEAPRESVADGGKPRQISTDADAGRQIPPAPTAPPIPQPAKPLVNMRERVALGLPLPERCDKLMAALREVAEADGRVPLTLSQMSKRTGIPEGSIGGTLKALQDDGLIRRADGVTYLVKPKAAKPVGAKAAEPMDTNVHSQPPALAAPATAPKRDELPVNGAFDSKAPKPEWDFGRSGAIVKAPQTAGSPDGLAMSGCYLILGKHHIRLPDQSATIMGRLIKDWGSSVRKADLAGEIIARSVGVMSEKTALTFTELKALAEINAAIKPAGLVVLEKDAAWRLQVRQEAGVTA